jgi:hypothetical protein
LGFVLHQGAKLPVFNASFPDPITDWAGRGIKNWLTPVTSPGRKAGHRC